MIEILLFILLGGLTTGIIEALLLYYYGDPAAKREGKENQNNP
jgi:hypothetical protein